MRIGFVANATALECKANHTFRLASYSEQRLFETVARNLDCLEATLRHGVRHELRFFRISSDTVPFASHPVCRADWRGHFAPRLAAIGAYIRREGIRISMHPGQYTVLNTPDPELHARSVAELHYHMQLLDALGLDNTAKIQLHVGGIYGDKAQALATFCARHRQLGAIASRLAIENDDRRFSLHDCLAVHAQTGVPVIFDTLHHACLNRGEPLGEALGLAAATWKKADGRPMVDYSSQQPGRPRGTHADGLDAADFEHFLAQATPECDVMMELRDKDRSALKAARLAARRGKLG